MVWNSIQLQDGAIKEGGLWGPREPDVALMLANALDGAYGAATDTSLLPR